MDATFAKSISVPISRLKTLRQKSSVRGAVQAFSHMGAIALNSWALIMFWGTIWAVPFFMLQGILINCLYAGVHELSHETVFKSKKINVLLGRIFGFVLIIGRDQDKFEHFRHHRYTQDVERDAEIIGGTPFNLFTYLLYFSAISYWPGRIWEVVSAALGRTAHWPYLSPAQMNTVHREARIMLILYAILAVISVLLQSWALVFFWLLPMFSMKWFQMMQNIAEHTGMPHEQDILVNTRTIKANPVMKWLLWNMPFHMAHHSYPMIPFHKLPQLHAEIIKALGYEPDSISHLGFQKHMLGKLLKEGSSRYSGQDIKAY